MGKKYNNVLEMTKDISDEEDFNKALEEEIKNKQISKALFAMRCKAGLTQKELAEKAGFTQGKISKIENAFDNELTLNDLTKYCSAINMQIEIGFSNMETRLVDRVKHHYFALMECLIEMRHLAKGDKSIEEGVEKFHEEAFANITTGMPDCLLKVKIKEEKKPLHVSSPIDLKALLERREKALTPK